MSNNEGVLWLSVGLGILAILIILATFGGLIGGLIYEEATSYNTQGSIITSTQYNAGTIKDGDTYTVIGYNLTVEYHGQVISTTVLCPLYPVGANIPIAYYSGWWGANPSISIGNLPAGCEPPNSW